MFFSIQYSIFEKGDSSKRQRVNGCSFSQALQQNFSWFCLNTRKRFFLRGFIFKVNRKNTILGIFKIALFLRDRHGFMRQCNFNFEKNFLESENLFQKWGTVFSAKIENATFPYKTALSGADIKTIRMRSTKWTYHKERSFASNYIF